MNQRNIIKSLGLSDQETDIYLALLHLNGAKASAVAKEVDMKRTTVYPILKTLARKGFANVYFRDNHRHYYAQPPRRVSVLFAKKLDAFEQLIPSLETIQKKQPLLPGLRFIETLDELKAFYETVLTEYENKSYCIIGSANGWEGLDPDFFVQFRKDRGNHKIKTRLLLSADSQEVNPTDPALLRTYKYLPATYRFKSTIDIYDNKVLVVSPELSALAVLISVPVMTDVFRSMFEVLWDMIGDDT